MKKIRQYVAMAAAAVMIASVVPAKITYADEVTDIAAENSQITEDVQQEDEIASEDIMALDAGDDSVDKVTSIECVEKTSSTLTLTWNKLKQDTNDSFFYKVRYMSSDDFSDTKTISAGNNNSLKLENLQPDTEYYVWVYAMKIDNSGTIKSNRSCFSTLKQYVTQDYATIDSMKLSWNDEDAPANEHPSYEVSYYEYNKPDTEQKLSVNENKSVVLSNLKSDTEYTIKITARDTITNTERVLEERTFETKIDMDALKRFETEKVSDSIVTQEDLTRNSMKISWKDDGYQNYNYMIIASSTKLTAPTLQAPDTHILYANNTNTIELTDLKSGMPYDIQIIRQDTNNHTSTTIDRITLNTAADFLVLVGESLYANSEIQSKLDTYVKDLRYEQGIGAEIVRVSKTEESEGVNKCKRPIYLKTLINKKYNNGNGAQGFVIVGSGEDIPNVFVENYPEENEYNPSDFYYADVDGEWIDSDNDGAFEYCKEQFKYPKNKAEMYFGRIDAKGIANYNGEKSEVELVNEYLDRIHNYRQKGYTLENEEARNRGLLFVDNKDFRTRKTQIKPISSVVSNVKGIYDEDETCKSNWINELEKGYALVHLTAHSNKDIDSFSLINNTDPDEDGILLKDIAGRESKLIPQFNFMDLMGCYACQYGDRQNDTEGNMGEAYLYKSPSGLNIVGGTKSMYNTTIDENEEFYNDLAKGELVGNAFKKSLNKYGDESDKSYLVLLGDPTLQYNLNKPSNETPYITTNLAGYDNNYASVKVGNCLELYSVDKDDDTVYYEVSGLPDNAVQAQNENIFVWKPCESDEGKTYNVTVTAYNKDNNGNKINSYTETFNVDVKPADGLGTEYTVELRNQGVNIFGDYLDWKEQPVMNFSNIYVDESGDYTIRINYSSSDPFTGNITAFDSNNQKEADENLSFDKHDDNLGSIYNTFDYKEVTIHLNKGMNDIVLTNNNDTEGWHYGLHSINVTKN